MSLDIVYKYAIALGYSDVTNKKQRELPWYALWNTILYHSVPNAVLVAPQYPLWHFDDIPPQDSSAPYTPHGDKSRIPDFAVLHVYGAETSRKSSDPALRGMIVGNVPQIPLIVEIKKLVREDKSNSKAIRNERNKMLEIAKEDAVIQAQYLFANHPQTKVYAVVACADYWQWTCIIRTDRQPASAQERDDPTFRPDSGFINGFDWSGVQTFKTSPPTSDTEFQRVANKAMEDFKIENME